MTIKYNRQNTNFQILNFIAGSCHTPDAAYFALLNLLQEREQAVDGLPVTELRFKAKEIEIKRKLASKDEVERLMGEAEALQFENDKKVHYKLAESARAELQFIQNCIARLQPYRKYSHLSDVEASEAYQAEEWGLELKRRAENFLITTGTIPHDHFNTMRLHPAFEQELMPHIENIHKALQSPEGASKLLKLAAQENTLPKLLGLAEPEALATQTLGDHPAQ